MSSIYTSVLKAIAQRSVTRAFALLFALVVTAGVGWAATTIPAGTTPVAVATNPTTNKTYVVNQDSNSVTVINADRTTLTIPVGTFPVALAINVTTNRIYVASKTVSTVTVISGATDTVITTIQLPTAPTAASPNAIAVDPVLNTVYVVNKGNSTVSVISGATNAITQTVTTGTSPHAVAVNPVTNRIYVANSGSNNVTVINGLSYATDTVNASFSPQSIAVNPVTNKIYVLNFLNNTLEPVTVINGATNTPAPIALGGTYGNSLAINPVTNRVYVSKEGGGSNQVAVINGANDTVLGNITVGNFPYALSVNVLTNQVFVGNRNDSTVDFIDGGAGAFGTVQITPAVPTGTQPKALAVNPITNVLYVANSGSASVTWIDVNTPQFPYVAQANVTAGTTALAIAHNPVTNKTYVTNAGSVPGSVTVISGGTNSTQTVVVGANPRAVAVNPLTDKIYVANRDGSTVTVINGTNNATTTIAVGTNPSAVVVNAVTNRIYVTNEGTNSVSVINGGTDTVAATVPVGATPKAVAVNEVTNVVYVANFGASTVGVINGATNTLTTSVNVGATPVALVVNPDTNMVYVANQGANTVSVIDGTNNTTTSNIPVGSSPNLIALNRVTNRIYVANSGAASISVINGTSATVIATWSLGGTPAGDLAVNPVRNLIYVGRAGGSTSNIRVYLGSSTAVTGEFMTSFVGPQVERIGLDLFRNRAYVSAGNSVRVINEQNDQTSPLMTSIGALTGNRASTTPTFTFTATSGFSPTQPPVRSVQYQIDTWTGPWSVATPSGSSWTGQAAALKQGPHILYAYATDGQDTTADKFNDGSSPIIGSITAYYFIVDAEPVVTSIAPTTGTAAGGTAVTIAGQNFATGATVTIGGAAATSVVVGSALSITAVTPAGSPGAATVAVTNPTGGIGTLAGGFTYTCSYALSASSASATTAGGAATVTVTTQPGCAWTALSNQSFISITAGSSGSGSGTVSYTVAANASSVARSGTMTIAGSTFTVNQQAVTCAFTLAPTSKLVGAPASAGNTVAVTATASDCAWTASSNAAHLTVTGGATGTGNGTVTYSVSANTSSVVRSGTLTIAGSTFTVTQATIPTLTLSPVALRFAARHDGAGTVTAKTPTQNLTLTANAPGSFTWTASSSQPWLTLSPSSGTGAANISVSITNAGNVLLNTGALTATITVTASGAANNPSAPVNLRVLTGDTGSPFGFFDTPLPGSALNGSFAVTGWTLDDIGIDHVEIWRDRAPGETTSVNTDPGPGNGKIFIARPFFISGARPDVELLNPTIPLSSRSGWGYLLLSYGLWNQGNGPFTLYAFAFDVDGHSTVLGSKTITVSNATAVTPFGSIDVPSPGQTMSGAFYNFGWALTPNRVPPCSVGASGVLVSVDSGPLQPVSYGDLRPDIAGLFPGFSNGAGAGGAYYLDTTGMTNGTHSIAWSVTDSCGRSDGIGSRFFTVFNAGSATTPTEAAPPVSAAAVADAVSAPIEVRRAAGASLVDPNPAGTRVVSVAEGQRVEVVLPPAAAGTYQGYAVVNGERRALPLGSSLDAQGIFYWQPAAGFLGAHDLQFVAGTGTVDVRIIIGTSVQAVIDTPGSGFAGSSFVVAGWAIDEAATSGSGIDTVHVWAYPASGDAPIFLGVADTGGSRPDIGALFGERFTRAGYDLTVEDLPAGDYDIVVYPHSAVSGDFRGARTVSVRVR